MKDEPESLNENHFSTNPHTHYLIEFKDNKGGYWIHRWTNGSVKCFGNLEAATREVKGTFKDNKRIEEASVIEWKKTIKLFQKNVKPEPVIESTTVFDVEVLNESKGTWYIRRYGLETLKKAQDYIKHHTSIPLFAEHFRIVQRDTTIKSTIV